MSKLRVRILTTDDAGDDKHEGDVLWDGHSMRVSPESHLMRTILEKRITAPVDGVLRHLSADDRETFLHGLHKHYRSVGLRATRVEEMHD